MIYVDSNYWIYWLDSRLPEHRHTVEVMRKAISNGIIASYITLIEVAHYLRRLPKEEFARCLKRIQNLSTLTMIELDHQITQSALDILPDYAAKGLGGRDCVIIATMKLSGVRSIATHDLAFKNVQGIRVIDTIPPKE
ncbi:MAG: type II toxin-antitoxin system VapC family toxin [Nitrososphaerales archaeon]